MKCKNCNAELDAGAKFCGTCGARVEQYAEETMGEKPVNGQSLQDYEQSRLDNEQSQSVDGQNRLNDREKQPDNEQNQPAQQSDPQQSTPQRSGSKQINQLSQPMNLKLIAIVAAVIVIILIIASMVSSAAKNRKQEISLEDYITVTSAGYDGYGTISITFDEDTYHDEMLEKSNVEMTKSDDGDYTLSSYLTEEYDLFYSVYDNTDYEADKTEGLSNGDVVTITFTYDEEKAKEVGIKFKTDIMEYTVSGLDEVVEIDPFEDITVEFTGTAPYAYANVVNNSKNDVISEMYFSLDKSSNIALGDTVTVSINTYSDEDYYLENYGCKFTQTSKEFVCENVDYYAANTDDVDDSLLEQMKGQTEDVIEAYFATESDYLKASDITYLGYYFLSYKGSSSYNSQNMIYLVYSASVSSTDSAFDTTIVYLPVRYKDIVIYADGTSYVDLSGYYGIIGDTSLSYGWWSSVSGYDSITLLKNDLITSQKGDYTDSVVGDLE